MRYGIAVLARLPSGIRRGKGKLISGQAQRHAAALATAETTQEWQLRRIDIRSPVDPAAWPVARVELHHPSRGRVADIASAPGAFDAAFSAAAQILGIAPRLVRFDVCSAAPAGDFALSIQIDVRLELDGCVYLGSCFGVDLLRCAICAWLEAASKQHSAAASLEAQPSRPFQVRGIDENRDLWIFASDDEGAAHAIAAEFEADAFASVDVLTRPTLPGAATRAKA